MKLKIGQRIIARDWYGRKSKMVVVQLPPLGGGCNDSALKAAAAHHEPEIIVDYDIVRRCAPPPTDGTKWSNGPTVVQVSERGGMMIVHSETETRLPQACQGSGFFPYYVGSLIGAARWLLECGYKHVKVQSV